ncbi:MAG TPA: hypothetical protein VNY05_30600, partial [Candidatus Acidoferrales bacterium]|nr:hypothetical protein [Candidatus Acidoferrales bacterium]
AGRLLRDLDQGWLAGGIHTSSMEQVLQNEKYFVITRAEFFTASHGAVVSKYETVLLKRCT